MMSQHERTKHHTASTSASPARPGPPPAACREARRYLRGMCMVSLKRTKTLQPTHHWYTQRQETKCPTAPTRSPKIGDKNERAHGARTPARSTPVTPRGEQRDRSHAGGGVCHPCRVRVWRGSKQRNRRVAAGRRDRGVRSVPTPVGARFARRAGFLFSLTRPLY